MDFNSKRFLELLEEEQEYDKQGKNFWKDNIEKAKELALYSNILESAIFWEHRKSYLEIITNFVDEKITADEFEEQFLALTRRSSKEFKIKKNNLRYEENITINPKSKNFINLISRIADGLLKIYDSDLAIGNSNPYEIDREVLRLIIKDQFFLDFMKYCDYDLS